MPCVSHLFSSPGGPHIDTVPPYSHVARFCAPLFLESQLSGYSTVRACAVRANASLLFDHSMIEWRLLHSRSPIPDPRSPHLQIPYPLRTVPSSAPAARSAPLFWGGFFSFPFARTPAPPFFLLTVPAYCTCVSNATSHFPTSSVASHRLVRLPDKALP